MTKIPNELKKIVDRVKTTQKKLQQMVNNHEWVDEARKYASRQGKEAQKLIQTDVEKVKRFLEKERKELQIFQKQIPTEVKKIKAFVKEQQADFGKLLENIRKLTKESVQKTKDVKAKDKKTVKSSSSRKKSTHSGSDSETQVD